MTTPDGVAAYQAYREGLEAAPGARNPYSGRPVLAAMWLRGHQAVTDKTITNDMGECEMSSTDSAQEIVDRLNAYEASHAADDYSDKPINNIWQDVIVRLSEYDQDATERAGDDTIILRDGSIIRWDVQRGEWYVA